MRAWQIYPHYNGNFTDSCSDCSYFFPTVRAQHLAGQVLADLTPFKYQFHRFLPSSESSYLADQVLEEQPPFQKAISQIHAQLWEFIFGRPGFGRSTPSQMAISQVPALTVYIYFLIWELIFGRPGLGRSTPLQMAISQIPDLFWDLILADQLLADLTPQ